MTTSCISRDLADFVSRSLRSEGQPGFQDYKTRTTSCDGSFRRWSTRPDSNSSEALLPLPVEGCALSYSSLADRSRLPSSWQIRPRNGQPPEIQSEFVILGPVGVGKIVRGEGRSGNSQRRPSSAPSRALTDIGHTPASTSGTFRSSDWRSGTTFEARERYWKHCFDGFRMAAYE